MRIGLVGYFGWGNYGDELFLEAYQKAFLGHELVIFHDPFKGAFLDNADQLIASVDVIVIGGGDLIIPWYKSWLYWDERFLQKPVFVFGVGVPTWGKSDPVVLMHYQKFLSHPNVKMISCRDEESVQWVNRNIKTDRPILFAPDMVLALRFPQQVAENNVLGIILRKQNDYVPDKILEVSEVAKQLNFSIRLIMLGTGRTLSDDYEVFQKIRFPSYEVVVRDSISELSTEIASCRYLISMKFHGIVAAYKCGVPFISLSGADKFKSFMKQTGNEKYSSAWTDSALSEKFERLVYEGTDFSKRDEISKSAKAGLNKMVDAVLSLN